MPREFKNVQWRDVAEIGIPEAHLDKSAGDAFGVLWVLWEVCGVFWKGVITMYL